MNERALEAEPAPSLKELQAAADELYENQPWDKVAADYLALSQEPDDDEEPEAEG